MRQRRMIVIGLEIGGRGMSLIIPGRGKEGLDTMMILTVDQEVEEILVVEEEEGMDTGAREVLRCCKLLACMVDLLLAETMTLLVVEMIDTIEDHLAGMTDEMIEGMIEVVEEKGTRGMFTLMMLVGEDPLRRMERWRLVIGIG